MWGFQGMNETISILQLVLALIAVESSGIDDQIGDDGRAFGCLQIHGCYVADASEHAGVDWTHEDAFDRVTSLRIFSAYMERYATPERLGTVTAEKMARIHNGGPNGWKKESTVRYWKKVEAELIKMGAI